MDIMNLIDVLEEAIESSWTIPFTSKSFVDKDELLEAIQDIRLKYPEELKQAKYITEERQRILIDAQKEADNVVKAANDKALTLVAENEITRQANAEAAKIMEQAQNEARNMRMATKEYVAKSLNDLDTTLTSMLQKVKDDKRSL